MTDNRNIGYGNIRHGRSFKDLFSIDISDTEDEGPRAYTLTAAEIREIRLRMAEREAKNAALMMLSSQQSSDTVTDDDITPTMEITSTASRIHTDIKGNSPKNYIKSTEHQAQSVYAYLNKVSRNSRDNNQRGTVKTPPPPPIRSSSMSSLTVRYNNFVEPHITSNNTTPTVKVGKEAVKPRDKDEKKKRKMWTCHTCKTKNPKKEISCKQCHMPKNPIWVCENCGIYNSRSRCCNCRMVMR